jgi:hypothetical protein
MGILSMLKEDNFCVAPAFVFDEAKSRANKAKHGIDFLDAQALW